jgi:peptide chain release factor 2
MRERQHLETAINAVRETERELDDNLGLIELGEAEGDEGVVADAEEAIAELARHAARRQVETLLSGEADRNDTYLEVHAGAGGTESQDWAQMLLRM